MSKLVSFLHGTMKCSVLVYMACDRAMCLFLRVEMV
jgi:hypothetical protein